MSNMSYCRYENTWADLRDCYEAMNDGIDGLSPTEAKYRARIITLCEDIVADFGDDNAKAIGGGK